MKLHNFFRKKPRGVFPQGEFTDKLHCVLKIVYLSKCAALTDKPLPKPNVVFSKNKIFGKFKKNIAFGILVSKYL